MKSSTISKILIILFLSFLAKTTYAQDPIGEANAELRRLFSNTNPPISNTRSFLYDMAAHIVDSSFFNNYNTNVGSTDNWYLLYSEMRNMAYDTTQFITDDSLFYRVTKNILKDTIPLGLMAYDFYLLEPNAFTSNTYFNFDTINDLLSDKNPRPSGPCGLGPYCINTVFAGSPMIRDSKYSTVNFKFSPENFLRDNFQFSIEQNLGIDFGDGTGWHTIDPFTTTTINIKQLAIIK